MLQGNFPVDKCFAGLVAAKEFALFISAAAAVENMGNAQAGELGAVALGHGVGDKGADSPPGGARRRGRLFLPLLKGVILFAGQGVTFPS